MAGWGQGRCYKMIEQLPKLSLPKLMEEDVENKKKKSKSFNTRAQLEHATICFKKTFPLSSIKKM